MTLVPIEDQQVALAPREVIAGAKEQADALMEIVESRKLYAMVSGKQYLEAEAWEIICAFNNVAPDVVYVNPIEQDGETVAYEAKVNLIDRNGALRGSGIAECSLDSFPTKGRVGRDKDKAAKSAAQTWAISKAARMAFSWVAVLAGFEPTPAAEMRGTAPATDYGTCEKHGAAYFKSDKMHSPAHRKDDGSWCNKPKDPPERSTQPTQPVSEPQGTEQPAETDEGPALFPPEQASASPEAVLKIKSDAGLWKALARFGLNKKEHTAAIEKLIDMPLAQAGDLQAVYDRVALEHRERTHRPEQEEQPENTEA